MTPTVYCWPTTVPSSALGIVVERIDELDAVIAELREIIALSDEQVEQFHEAKKRARRPGEPVVIADNLSDATSRRWR